MSRIEITATKATWVGDRAFYELTARVITRGRGSPLPVGEFIVFDPGGHRKQIDGRGTAFIRLSTSTSGIFTTTAILESDPDVRDTVEVVVPEKTTKSSEDTKLEGVERQVRQKTAEGTIKQLDAAERIGHLKTQLEEKRLNFALANIDSAEQKKVELEISRAELEIARLELDIELKKPKEESPETKRKAQLEIEKIEIELAQLKKKLEEKPREDSPEVVKRAQLENRRIELEMDKLEKSLQEKLSEAELQAKDNKARAESAEAEKKIREANMPEPTKSPIKLNVSFFGPNGIQTLVISASDDLGLLIPNVKGIVITESEGVKSFVTDNEGVAKYSLKQSEKCRRVEVKVGDTKGLTWSGLLLGDESAQIPLPNVV